jgi:hypothetical protein
MHIVHDTLLTIDEHEQAEPSQDIVRNDRKVQYEQKLTSLITVLDTPFPHRILTPSRNIYILLFTLPSALSTTFLPNSGILPPISPSSSPSSPSTTALTSYRLGFSLSPGQISSGKKSPCASVNISLHLSSSPCKRSNSLCASSALLLAFSYLLRRALISTNNSAYARSNLS